MVLDTVASRVMGFVQARDCRVVWKDGVLYVVKGPSDIIALRTEAPTKHAGTYKVSIGVDTIRFQVPSCGSCRRRVQASPIGRMTVDEIVAAASVEA